MQSLRRLRWLVPRFSLSNLLMLMVVVGISLAWYDQRRKLGEQAEVIEKQRQDIVRLSVQNIVLSAASDAEKAKALEPFITVGDKEEHVKKWCGDWDSFSSGGWLFRTTYHAAGLQIECVNGRVWDFGYHKKARPHELMFVSLGRDLKGESAGKDATSKSPE